MGRSPLEAPKNGSDTDKTVALDFFTPRLYFVIYANISLY